jgi:protein-S-isoprenylcysteine O-methyltransferase Ste14
MNAAIPIWLTYALWLILIIYLSLSAIGVKPDTEAHLGQSLALLFAIIAAFTLPHLPIFELLNFAPVSPLLSAIGMILTVAGMGCLVWARQHLGRNWSQTVSAKHGHELVTSGPYRYVRHPMYTGGLIACFGSAIVTHAIHRLRGPVTHYRLSVARRSPSATSTTPVSASRRRRARGRRRKSPAFATAKA